MHSARIKQSFRTSSVPYLTVILFGAFSSAFLAYIVPLIWRDNPVFFGQSPAIIAPFVVFPFAVLIWSFYDGNTPRNRAFHLVVSAFALLWVFHFGMDRIHGSQSPYFFLLTLPILGLIWLKPPKSSDARDLFLSLGVTITLFLLLTRLLEIAQILPMYDVQEYIVRFDNENYWLPFSGQLGLEGRWTGPTGSTTRTSVVASLLVLIGAKYKSVLRIPFILVGTLAILLAGSRTGYFTIFGGLFTLILLSDAPSIRRVPFWIRTVFLLALGAITATVLMILGPGTTGRSGEGGIWSGFFEAWKSSPLFGVGKDLIPNPDSATRFSYYSEAHNMFVGEGASYGWVGVTLIILTLFLLIFVGLKAAVAGNALPVAILFVYIAASLTDVYNDWVSANYAYITVLICSISAAVPFSFKQTRRTLHIRD